MNHRNDAIDERAGSVFEPDTMLASQYFDRIRRRSELDPERRLMIAVLEDAVTVCLKGEVSADPARQTLLSEAEEWVADRDATWLYAFENICAVLDLDADYIRRGLRARKEARRPRVDGAASGPESGDEPLRRASGE